MADPSARKPVAIVTGAAQGLGHEIALRLAADGFAVAVNDIRDDGRLSALAEKIGGLAVPADISDADSVRELATTVVDQLGGVDVLVGNAAAMEMGPFLTQDPAIWWRQIDVNLSGHFRLVQAVVPHMRAAGGGRIVLIASGWGVIGHPNATAYAASKAGLVALTKGLGRELGPQGILTNADPCAPPIDTEQAERRPHDRRRRSCWRRCGSATATWCPPVSSRRSPTSPGRSRSWPALAARRVRRPDPPITPTGGVTRTRA